MSSETKQKISRYAPYAAVALFLGCGGSLAVGYKRTAAALFGVGLLVALFGMTIDDLSKSESVSIPPLSSDEREPGEFGGAGAAPDVEGFTGTSRVYGTGMDDSKPVG